MNVQITDKVDNSVWDDFILRHPLGSIFHHSSWQDVVIDSYGYKPIYHLALDDSSNITAAAVSAHVESRLTGNRIISFPFSDSCDLLVNNDAEAEVLMKALEATRSRLAAEFIEYRFMNAQHFVGGHRSDGGYSSYLLPLQQNRDILFRSFHRSCIQRAIKTGQQRGVETFHGSSLSDIKTFYHLHLLTRKKHGVAVQPFGFFRNLWSTLAPRKMITLLLARHQQRIIAGIIVLWFKNIAYYKFGASDERFLNIRANQLLMWEAIQLAQRKGCSTFDFGRTNQSNEGLSLYKQRWGSQRVSLYYVRVPKDTKSGILKESSRTHGRLKKMMSWMPAALIRLSGEFLYRHLA